METTSIVLDNYFTEFIGQQVKAGQFNSEREVVIAGLKLLEQKQMQDKLIAELQKGEESGFVENFDKDISTLFLSSCSKDEDSGNNDLLGKWYIYSINTIDQNGLSDCESKSWVEFKKDTFTSKDYYDNASGVCSSTTTTLNYSIKGDKIVVSGVDIDEQNIQFNISGNKLTLYNTNGKAVYKKN